MINLQIAESVSMPVDLPLLEKAAQTTLEMVAAEQSEGSGPEAASELTVLVSDDAQLQQLNRDFLGIDAPTDVLSFPADYTDPDTQANYLGDVIISYSRAVQQAQAAGHPPEAELQLLVVHGVLHLLGYDHAEPEEKETMWALQAKVLARLGIDASRLPIE